MARIALIPLFLATCSDGDVAGPAPSPEPNVATVEVDRSTLDFDAVGATIELTATAHDASGAPVVGAEFAWSTDGTGVVEVDVPGAGQDAAGTSRASVAALGNGTETIRVAVGDVSAAVTASVAQLPTSLRATTSSDVMHRVGETGQIAVDIFDANGAPLTEPGALSTVTFSSSAPNIVAVDDDGRTTANWVGAATIGVAAGELETTVDVEVRLLHDALGEPIVGEPVPCAGGMAGPFPCDRIDLVAYLPPAALGVPEDASINDMWGWEDELAGRRYALVARSDGVTFVDVTNVLAPRPVGYLPEAVPSVLWRDLKVHADHMYVVADIAEGHGVQVFDLTRLRDVSVFTTFTEDSRYAAVSAAHNIAINEETGFAYVVGSGFGGLTCGGGLHMIDLSDPLNPTFAGCFADTSTGSARTGYTHDVQCVVYGGPDLDYSGREICFGSNETAVSISDVTDKSSPVAIATADYPGAEYVHQGWLTEDQRYFIQNDELDELSGTVAVTRMLVWDVADLDDPVLAREYFGPTTATDHNLYVLGQRVYHSSYAFGFRLIDVADPLNPVDVGFFDTYPLHDEPGFVGSWSNYPFFDDGHVIVTSDLEGLFILAPQT